MHGHGRGDPDGAAAGGKLDGGLGLEAGEGLGQRSHWRALGLGFRERGWTFKWEFGVRVCSLESSSVNGEHGVFE